MICSTVCTPWQSGTYDGTDRTQLQKEVKALKNEIDRIADSSNFNGTELLNGDLATGTSYTFKGTSASTDTANIDLVITADGTQAMKNIKFEHSDAATTAKASIDAAGVVTIKVSAKKNYSAEDIQNALSKATVDAATNADVADAIKGASVSGTGITGKATNGAKLAVASKTGDKLPGKALKLQIGDTGEAFNQLSVSIKDCHVKALGLDKMSIADQDGAKAALDQIKSAINYVSDVRGTLGATQNRLEHTINNLSVMEENIQDAESTIRDTDVADEMMAYTKNNILVQSAQAMLAQANQVPQGVLQLLQ